MIALSNKPTFRNVPSWQEVATLTIVNTGVMANSYKKLQVDSQRQKNVSRIPIFHREEHTRKSS